MEILWRQIEKARKPVPKNLKKWEKNWDRKVEKLGFEKRRYLEGRKNPKKSGFFLGRSQFFPRNFFAIRYL